MLKIFNRRREAVSEFSVALTHLKDDKLAISALGFIAFLLVVAIFADFISPYDPIKVSIPDRLSPPSWEHPFGADGFGRDILSRIIHGTRISLIVGFQVIAISLLIGTITGAVAGYYGGKIDEVIMRVADVFLAFPGLILAISIMAVFGPGIFNVVIALTLVNWAGYARVIRSQVLSVKGLEYIESSRVMGAADVTIIIDHVVPNSIAPLIVLATIGIGWAILAEAGLSFLGLGVRPPTPSWGAMVAAGRLRLLQAPHIVTIPGLVIAITVLAFNLLGDGLRDALDPKLRI